MRLSFGFGGWLAVSGLDLPGPAYVRVKDVGGRLVVSELYLDTSGGEGRIEASDLRHLPLMSIEAAANQYGEMVRVHLDQPGPDLSTLASYFATSFGNKGRQVAEGNWVVASFVAQEIPAGAPLDVDSETGGRVLRVDRAPRSRHFKRVTSEFRLLEGPTKGLTDEFLTDVARAYNAAISRGERPNKAIAQQVQYPTRTVERWVYTARQRGILPPGKKGSAG